MDSAPVPFPSMSLKADEKQKPETRPALHSRIHSSPSLPDLWLPSLNGVPSHRALQHQARHRPHLRPLDLAASPTKSRVPFASSGLRPAAGSPSRAPSLLTPPLTPSSSFVSNTNETPSTPPESASHLRWIRNAGDVFTGRALFADAEYSPTSGKGQCTFPQSGYLTPSSGRTQSISSDAERNGSPGSFARPDVNELVSALAAGITDLDLTPRDERKLALNVNRPADDLADDTVTPKPSRFLMVRHVKPTASSSDLRSAFAPLGDIKGIMVRFLETHGLVILAFCDLRQAARAKAQLPGQVLEGLGDNPLDAIFIDRSQLEEFTGPSGFVAETDGGFRITVEDCLVQPTSLQNVLASFGELMSFDAVAGEQQTYDVEYHDIRDAASAFKALKDRRLLGAHLRLSQKGLASPGVQEDPFVTPESPYRTQPFSRGLQSADAQDDTDRTVHGRIRPRSVSASEMMGAPDAVRRLRKAFDSPTDAAKHTVNELFFDSVGKVPVSPDSPLRPRSISIGAEETLSPTRNAAYYDYEYSQPYSPASAPPYGDPSRMYAQAGYPHGGGMYRDPGPDTAGDSHWAFAAPPAMSVEYYIPPSPRSASHYGQNGFPTTPRRARQAAYSGFGEADADQAIAYSPVEQVSPYRRSAHQPAAFDYPSVDPRMPSAQGISDKNQLNIPAIEEGKDMRTTVMIKNIPNKMSDRDLLNFINKVCARRIDFMYLRMDFQNGCNVGYAFVNFITVGDLLHFAKTQLGVKWNMYSSEKVLQMCYATYQGKEALVEKFKNSCIMDEREAWRPKIFYSDGPKQGLPEPFPAPTHLRRKERSSHNRGALFVPGAHHVQGARREGGPALYHRSQGPRMGAR